MEASSRPPKSDASPENSEARLQEETRFRLKQLGFPERACDHLWNGLDKPDCWDSLASVDTWSGFVGAIIGGNGTGKTQLATAYASHLYWEKNPAVHVSRYTTLNDLHAMEHSDREKFVRKLRRCDLLVIDEYDKANHTEYLINTMCSVINYRCDAYKDTLLITNMTEGALLGSLDRAVADRLRGYGFIIEMTGGSLR